MLVVFAAMTGCVEDPVTDFDTSDAHIIDTRQRLHWSFEHIEGARHIAWDCIVVGVQQLGIGEEEPIVIYDQTESRAKRAEVSLRNMGYQYVKNAGSVEDAQALLDRPMVTPEDTEPSDDEKAIMEECTQRRSLRPEP